MAAENFYRNPRLTTISFAVGLLLFFLPFVEVKCNGTTLAQMSGINLVTGAEPKVGSDFERMAKGFDKKEDTPKADTKTGKKGKVYIFAIVALALGATGLAISLIKKGIYNKSEMLAGIIGGIALIALLIHVKADIGSELKSKDAETDQFAGMMNISVDFTIWFFICVLCYFVAAFFSYKQKQLVNADEIPPASAPQLNIKNPGDQSDFPAAASGDKDLG